ncbi:sigma-70 family RNA polymerase sigma factor [Tsuneonella sp. HG222]
MSGASDPTQLQVDLCLVGQQDRQAFLRLYRATAPKIFALCLHLTGRRSAAEDILQQVYVKVWLAASSYDPTRSQPMTWIGTIARNTAIDWHRKQGGTSQPISESEHALADGAESADERLVREEAERKAITLLSGLGSDEEVQIRRIYFEGLTFAQLAERENKPLGTVKSTVRRALLKLRQKFDDE